MNTVTETQVNIIDRLKAERSPNGEALAALAILRLEWHRGLATELRAEQVIKKLQALPLRNRARHIEPGVYETATGLVRVYWGQRTGRTLAKLVMWDGDKHVWFQYMGLASKHVSADARRLTVEEIGDATLAMNSTVCLVCGRRLDDPESVQRGIGPVCIQNYGMVAA
jgi:hypothetical protein